MRVALIGGVESSNEALKALIEHRFDIVRVYAFDPLHKDTVSGYCDLSRVATQHGLPFLKFRKINDHLPDLIEDDLDVLFVVGLSQLISQDILDLPRLGTVGFHPTALPLGRGRAPIAWLVQEQMDGAATFFELTNEADAGGILVQIPFRVSSNDDAGSVMTKVLDALREGLALWLPQLRRGLWQPVPQDESAVTEFGVRRPEDGVINWNLSAEDILRLIRASTSPHPGAYTYLGDQRMLIWEASSYTGRPICGVPGRILRMDDSGIVVQAGDAPVVLSRFDSLKTLRVGTQLGYKPENELYELRLRVTQLEAQLKIILNNGVF